jgi:hypothetical protein
MSQNKKESKMKKYVRSIIQTRSVNQFCLLSGQYIFEFTPDACPEVVIEGSVSSAEGFAYCDTASSPAFTATIRCTNIEGVFTATYGDSISGGGLTCQGIEESFINPLLSVSPALPGNCIVDEFVTSLFPLEDACGDAI